MKSMKGTMRLKEVLIEPLIFHYFLCYNQSYTLMNK